MPRKTQRNNRKPRKQTKKRVRKSHRGGAGNCGGQSGGMGVLDTAIVPFGILALQRYMKKRVKVPKSMSRRRRRKGKKN